MVPVSGGTLLPQVQRWIRGILNCTVHLGFFFPQQQTYSQDCRNASLGKLRAMVVCQERWDEALPVAWDLVKILFSLFLAGKLFSMVRP